MPTYQYACTDTECGNRFELVQSFTDPAASECPVCAGPVRKVYSSVGVVFKGSGFYRNDSRAASSLGSRAPRTRRSRSPSRRQVRRRSRSPTRNPTRVSTRSPAAASRSPTASPGRERARPQPPQPDRLIHSPRGHPQRGAEAPPSGPTRRLASPHVRLVAPIARPSGPLAPAHRRLDLPGARRRQHPRPASPERPGTARCRRQPARGRGCGAGAGRFRGRRALRPPRRSSGCVRRAGRFRPDGGSALLVADQLRVLSVQASAASLDGAAAVLLVATDRSHALALARYVTRPLLVVIDRSLRSPKKAVRRGSAHDEEVGRAQGIPRVHHARERGRPGRRGRDRRRIQVGGRRRRGRHRHAADRRDLRQAGLRAISRSRSTAASSQYGDLINQIISFVIIAAAIYFFIVVPLNKLAERRARRLAAGQPEDEPEAKAEDIILLEQIRDLLAQHDQQRARSRCCRRYS